jgi:hypothetical protein
MPRRANFAKNAIVMTTPDVAREKLKQHRTGAIVYLLLFSLALAIAIPPFWIWLRLVGAALALFSAYAVTRSMRHIRVWERFLARSGGDG